MNARFTKIIAIFIAITQAAIFFNVARANGENVTTFDGAQAVELSLPGGGSGLANIVLPRDANVTSAYFSISTNVTSGVAPTGLTVDICNDSEIDWHFMGQGYGAFGLQYMLASNMYSEHVLLDKNSGLGRYYNDSQALRMPKNAEITSAKINLTGNAIAPVTNRTDYTNSSTPSIASNNVNALEYDGMRDLLYVGTTEGLTAINLRNDTSMTVRNDTVPELISNNVVALKFEEASGRLLVGTDGAICMFDTASLSVIFSMNMTGINDLDFAGTNRLIVGTATGGLVVNMLNATSYEYTVATSPALLANEVRAVAYNPDRNIAYFGSGTNNGGVAAINLATNATFYYTKTTTPAIHQDNVRALEYEAGRLAVGSTSSSGGATIIDISTNTSRSFSSTTPVTLVSPNVFAVDYVPSSDSLIVGTNGGMTVVDLIRNTKTDYVSPAIISNTVNAVVGASGCDSIFVGTNLGITALIMREYPTNVTLDIGGQATALSQWTLKNKTTVDIEAQLSSALASFPSGDAFVDECGNIMCNLTINLSSSTSSEIAISDIEILYDYTANLSTLRNGTLASKLNAFLDGAPGTSENVTIPIKIDCIMPGDVRIHSIFISYTLPTNTAPYFLPISNLSIKAGESNSSALDLWSYGRDNEEASGDLTYSVVYSSNANITASIVGNRFLSIAVADVNATGLGQITLRVSDGHLEADELVNVTIIPSSKPNTPPYFTHIGNISFQSGSDYKKAIDLWAAAHDNETSVENLTYSIVANSNTKIYATINNGRYVGVKISAQSYSGKAQVTIQASDGEFNATTTVNITAQGKTDSFIPGGPDLGPLGNAWICCTMGIIGLVVAFGAILYMRHLEDKRAEEYRKAAKKKDASQEKGNENKDGNEKKEDAKKEEDKKAE